MTTTDAGTFHAEQRADGRGLRTWTSLVGALPAECLTRAMRTSLPLGREVPAAVRVAVAAPIGAAAAAIIGVNAADRTTGRAATPSPESCESR